MRIFIALDIEELIRERLQLFMDGVRGFAPEARWVRPESLHVTLKFIGNKSPEEVEEIRQALTHLQAGATRDSLSWLRILSHGQGATGFLGRRRGWSAAGRSRKIGGRDHDGSWRSKGRTPF